MNKKEWKILSEGDNYYVRTFESKYGLTAFLYTILENIDREDFNSFPQFDIEDDMITVYSPNGIIYTCRGWHWSWQDNYGEKELKLPDGETFYQKVSKY